MGPEVRRQPIGEMLVQVDPADAEELWARPGCLQRHDRGAVEGPASGPRSPRPPRSQAAGEGADGAGLEHQGERAGPAEPGLHGLRHLHGEQRMPAHVEEPVIDPDTVELEQSLPDRNEFLLQVVRGQGEFLAGDVRAVGVRQRLPIQLPARMPGKCIDGDEGHRNHVLGEARSQELAELAELADREVRHPQLRHDVGGQELPALGVHARVNPRLANLGVLDEGGLNLAGLYSHSPDLHLTVDSAQELQPPVDPAHAVARAVEPGAGAAGEGVGNEAFGGEIGPVQITASHSLSTHVEFSGHAYRHRLELPVEHVRLDVGHWPADVGAFLPSGDPARGGLDGAFRRPVRVECLHSGGRQLPPQTLLDGFAADDDDPRPPVRGIEQALIEEHPHLGGNPVDDVY